eukprot:TRINITY_DN3041_c0_g2_i2.p1 TRINITY_DN3041_c0_g2~~TRINITY_DN3041_c0_g2_i2.p1  ORF type:complete len:534 (+),score=239.21 TRINITY_DN3041_c0_g2_i2:56-1603(+)
MSAGKGADLAVLQRELHELDPRYRLDKIIGAGSYGVVLKGVDTTTKQPVAIKKISKVIFQDTRLAKRILREVKLLAHFHKNVVGEHRAENIIGLENLITPEDEDFKEFWITMELAESDLKSVFRSGQKLSLPQIQYMLYQMLHALNTMKAAGVIHRDITPANVLVSYSDLDIKICDFGLAREEPKGDTPFMTEYVTMRWYRAPELVMESKQYNEAVDMWGVGCILAEMFGSKPLFRGLDRINQLDKIIEVIGSPAAGEICFGSNAAQRYIRERYCGPTCRKGEKTRAVWKDLFALSREETGPEAMDLLDKMLVFNPAKRIAVEDALSHPFLSALHDPTDEDVRDVPIFDFSDEKLNNIGDVKHALYMETIAFHKRNPATFTQKLKAKLKSELNSLATEPTGAPSGRTGFETTVNPHDVPEDVEFEEANIAQLPAEVDHLVDTFSHLIDESDRKHFSPQHLLKATQAATSSSAGPVVQPILAKYGWNGKAYTREIEVNDIPILIKTIRDAFVKAGQ